MNKNSEVFIVPKTGKYEISCTMKIKVQGKIYFLGQKYFDLNKGKTIPLEDLWKKIITNCKIKSGKGSQFTGWFK